MVARIFHYAFARCSSWTSVLAAQTIATIVKSSLGPMGLDKMLVDNIGVSLVMKSL